MQENSPLLFLGVYIFLRNNSPSPFFKKSSFPEKVCNTRELIYFPWIVENKLLLGKKDILREKYQKGVILRNIHPWELQILYY